LIDVRRAPIALLLGLVLGWTLAQTSEAPHRADAPGRPPPRIEVTPPVSAAPPPLSTLGAITVLDGREYHVIVGPSQSRSGTLDAVWSAAFTSREPGL
jgi:hypothetical protein